MGKYFGTDGIRGIVNAGLDAELAFRVGQAASMVLSKGKTERAVFTIGKDTRISCDMLEAALVAGLCSAGSDVIRLGVVPTPAVAYITADCGADAGIVISASHNPYEHNGIKIFNGRGFKLSDEVEAEIEKLLDDPARLMFRVNGDIGHVVKRGREFVDKYVSHIASCAEGSISNMKVLVDCSNGAAVRTVNEIFGRFPISLELIKDHPNGININDGCGSTHPELLSKMVVAGGFDVGIAFDGDADRCIAVDENGDVVDGDKIMGLCGSYLSLQGKLKNNTIVATVMSNLGFHEYAEKQNIHLECTSVGDRYVLERMLEGGLSLGGEQSGHIIFLDDATTGDGQLAAVKFLSVVSAYGQKVSELAREIPTYPQVLQNVIIDCDADGKDLIVSDEMLARAVSEQECGLGARGRVLIRPSGTESLIRVMVEAETEQRAIDTAQNLSDFIKTRVSEILP